MKNILIQLDDINFSYEQTVVLEHISLKVREGEFWALIGPNGSGKSTLINIILGLAKTRSGISETFRIGCGNF